MATKKRKGRAMCGTAVHIFYKGRMGAGYVKSEPHPCYL